MFLSLHVPSAKCWLSALLRHDFQPRGSCVRLVMEARCTLIRTSTSISATSAALHSITGALGIATRLPLLDDICMTPCVSGSWNLHSQPHPCIEHYEIVRNSCMLRSEGQHRSKGPQTFPPILTPAFRKRASQLPIFFMGGMRIGTGHCKREKDGRS